MHKLANSLVIDHAGNNVYLRRTLLRVETCSYYLGVTKTGKRLITACLLLCAQHQESIDDLELVQVAQNFVDANDEHKKYFGPADYFFVNTCINCDSIIHVH